MTFPPRRPKRGLVKIDGDYKLEESRTIGIAPSSGSYYFLGHDKLYSQGKDVSCTATNDDPSTS